MTDPWQATPNSPSAPSGPFDAPPGDRPPAPPWPAAPASPPGWQAPPVVSPAGFTPYAQAQQAFAVHKRQGAWIAAGVMQLIAALLFGGFGVWFVTATLGRDDDLFGLNDLIRVVGVILIVVGVCFLLGGVGCVISKLWGAIVGLVVNTLAFLLFLAGIAADDGGNAGSYAFAGWFLVTMILCIIGMTRRRAT
jgi:hypothetical protein